MDLLIRAAAGDGEPFDAQHSSARYAIALAQNAREAIVKVERLAGRAVS